MKEDVCSVSRLNSGQYCWDLASNWSLLTQKVRDTLEGQPTAGLILCHLQNVDSRTRDLAQCDGVLAQHAGSVGIHFSTTNWTWCSAGNLALGPGRREDQMLKVIFSFRRPGQTGITVEPRDY